MTMHILLLNFISFLSDQLAYGTLTSKTLINKLLLSSSTVFISNVEQNSYTWHAVRDDLQIEKSPLVSDLRVVV